MDSGHNILFYCILTNLYKVDRRGGAVYCLIVICLSADRLFRSRSVEFNSLVESNPKTLKVVFSDLLGVQQ